MTSLNLFPSLLVIISALDEIAGTFDNLYGKKAVQEMTCCTKSASLVICKTKDCFVTLSFNYKSHPVICISDTLFSH
jgi:hypothetical protein